jgi:Cu/Zn superoxide dismutase
MKKIFLIVFSIFCIQAANANHLSSRLTLSARLQGVNIIPTAVTTTANGVASMMLSANMDTLQINIAVAGLNGQITGLHLHAGNATTNGPVLIDFMSQLDVNVVRTYITGATLAMHKNEILKGNTYIVVHSNAYANGELRGQVTIESDMQATAMLSGAQEVPAVATMATGFATFAISKDNRMLHWNVTTTGLSGMITAAHLHEGMMGMNGGVVEDLSTTITANGKSISGMMPITSTTLIAQLKAGTIYINVHTAANPSGEIRGQLMAQNGMRFDAKIDTAQIGATLATLSDGFGTAMLSFNAAMDSLMFDITGNNLTGPITAMHFHNAAAGSAGGVVLDLGPYLMGNRAMGTWTAANGLTPMLVKELLMGKIYIACHTTANPGGELRGQVFRLAREGYIFELDGSQEVPMVSTVAMGGGMVTIDRNQENAHYMFAFDGLSSPATGAHFHQGMIGTNGPVKFDLTTMMLNNGLYGYWTSSNATPFNAAHSLDFRNSNVYVNIHNMSNPNGEIRGQVLRPLHGN